MPRLLLATLAITSICLHTTTAVASDANSWTLGVNLHGERLEGFPVRSSKTLVSLLLRDGRLVEFAPNDVTQFRKASSTFSPFTAAEMRAELDRELAPRLEVTGTGHYLVAHPKGTGSQWAGRFEDLYRSMSHYFSVRGFEMREPEFPLAAIVWSKREDFLRYAAAEGANLPPGVIGYYSPITNRITLYDLGDGSKNAEAWRQNAATIVHEATHQTAFNTGIHRRFADTPKWVIEGLGTMFEAPGVTDARRFPNLENRINRDRLDHFRRYQKSNRRPLGFAEIVADERMFNQNPLDAYAEAWAMTFYLAEKLPRQYAKYLAKLGTLPPFSAYSSQQRMLDFKSAFGDNLKLFEANYLRFIDGLK